MAFGRRGPGIAPSVAHGRLGPSVPRAKASGIIVARRGGYLAGLASGALAFVASGLLAVVWAFSVSTTPDFTPEGVLVLILAGVGPAALVTYAISLALVDAILRAFAAGGRALYAGLCPILPTLLLILPAWVARPGSHPIYYAILILPGAVVGGAVLGGFRRRA